VLLTFDRVFICCALDSRTFQADRNGIYKT
jgi:hypothetical protein